jgi:hypothetical protein
MYRDLMVVMLLLLGCSGSTGGSKDASSGDVERVVDLARSDLVEGDVPAFEVAFPEHVSETEVAVMPEWSTCPDEPLATTETLAQKAAFYDDIAARLHIHPDLKWISDVRLKQQEVDCPEGIDGPCFEPVASLDEATFEDVEAFHTGENDGLWSGLYLASQAYRYGATQSPEALANIKLLLEGERVRMAVTGVPGLFTRQYIPAGVDGITCPADDAHYVVDVEKDDNRWVRIKDDGCVWVVDNQTMEWTGTDHCGLDEFAGWCWLDNVSQDEYGGHMLALGALLHLVDEPEVQATVRDLLEQVGVHMMENQLTFVDWDGRVTEHGWLFPMAMANTPGFLAIESLAWMRMAVAASDREDLQDFYDNCLLQKGGELDCLDWPLQQPKPFTDYFYLTALYNGPEGCTTNFNNVSMLTSAYQGLLMFEDDAAVRGKVLDGFWQEIVGFDNPKSTMHLRNPWYSFAWAAVQEGPLAPEDPVFSMVEESVCTLRQFPSSQAVPDMDNESLYPHYCDSRLGSSMAQFPIPLAQRCPSTFIFWKNPYIRHQCTAQPWEVKQPGDYLLAYWMGRYYGFISETL